MSSAISAVRRSKQRQQSAPSFADRADCSLIRASDLVRDAATPNRTSVLDISLSTLWRYVKDGRFPSPIRLSPGVVVWKVGDVRKWINERHAALPGLGV